MPRGTPPSPLPPSNRTPRQHSDLFNHITTLSPAPLSNRNPNPAPTRPKPNDPETHDTNTYRTKMSTNGANKPSKLHISTQSVNRLLKEKEYYLKEVDSEKTKVERLRAELREKIANGVEPEQNEEYLIDQRVRPPPHPPSPSLTRFHCNPYYKQSHYSGTKCWDGINADAQERNARSRRPRPSSRPSARRSRRR